MKYLTIVLLIFCLVLSGCTTTAEPNIPQDNSTQQEQAPPKTDNQAPPDTEYPTPPEELPPAGTNSDAPPPEIGPEGLPTPAL